MAVGLESVPVHREAFTIPRRSDETLGRGPRSEPRAPMQMVGRALGSLGFEVFGKPILRVWGFLKSTRTKAEALNFERQASPYNLSKALTTPL